MRCAFAASGRENYLEKYYVVSVKGKKKKKCAQIGKRASAAESVASAASAVSAECMSKVAC